MLNITLTKEEAINIIINLSIIRGATWDFNSDTTELLDIPIDLLTLKILEDK